ncbi:PEGA domain-containing protein [Methanoculleus horonobensis]|uniref:PEGA domain-containing protein n=1 Tax=Methanoculleus horonobensis TaxID=528314 RepID=UPI00082E4D6E|nr:PEGA domain-containing protein [Methanoculleus horonobensis]
MIGVTRICHIAGLLLLMAMISVIVQGSPTDETGDISPIDSRDPASSTDPGTGENLGGPQIMQITNRTGDQYFPRVSDNWIIWIENESEGTMGLYLYDIANRSERRIVDCSPFRTIPVISGNWIGWVESRNDSSGQYLPCVCVYSISDDGITQVTRYPAMPSQTSISRSSMFDLISTLDISDNGIVWHDRRNGNMDIYYANLTSGEEQQITSSPADQTSPSASGDLIVWAEKIEGEYSNIHLYNLTSGDLKRITDYPAVRTDQVVSGDHVVWAQVRLSDYDICCYNISSGNTTWITSESTDQRWPKLSGDLIVWSDNRSGNGTEIYTYDLSEQTETQVTNNSIDKVQADIDGSNIAWMENRTGHYAVTLCSLGNRSNTKPRAYAVQVNSIPQGADIYVNGEVRGRTPSTLQFDQSGSHPIEIVKKGFKPYTATLNVTGSMDYVANLQREGGTAPGAPLPVLMTVTVDSVPRGANVSIDGVHLGETLLTMDGLPVRDYTLEVTREGYQPNSTTVNSSEPVNVTLMPQETNEIDGDGLM